jgi:broad specificity phosphatase PhoE
MSDRVRIWCLRHAESEANAKVSGATEDCLLTELGRRQAVDAARKLAACLVGPVRWRCTDSGSLSCASA